MINRHDENLKFRTFVTLKRRLVSIKVRRIVDDFIVACDSLIAEVESFAYYNLIAVMIHGFRRCFFQMMNDS